MKINSRKCASWAAATFSAFALLSSASPARAGGDKVFAGDGRTAWNGPVGMATLELSDDTTNITGTLTVNQGDFGGNVLVIYIQSLTNGGFSNTSGFGDNGDGIRSAISGYGGQRSTLTFSSGFTPQFALGIQPGNPGFAGIWGLTNGGANSLPYIDSLNLSPNGTGPGTYTFTVKLSELGLPTGQAVVGKTLKLLGTLISTSGYRSPESIAGDTDGTSGWNPTLQTAVGTYLIGELPTTTYPVNFQVDMTAMLQNGDFNPGAGDQVEARGSFNNNAAGFFLTPSSGNTNIYTGTFQDANPLGTPENYLYDIANGGTVKATESTDPRKFTLASSQTLPVLYFSDLAPATNATVGLTFSVDMTAQTVAGKFIPSNGDAVYVAGDFSENSLLAWTPSTQLTPSSTNTNVYVGTVGDGNYTGTPAQYKFVYFSQTLGNNVYESIPNRTYNTPATATTYPTVYFNNVTNAAQVTFQVDMTSQIIGGAFTPGQDIVTVAGVFNGWNTTINPCTNNPAASNTNIYSTTIGIADAPGTPETYKFTTSGPGISGTDYESPAASTPTIGGNRYFNMVTSNTVLPVVFFSDQSANDILTQDTFVTFTVNMTNAVGTDTSVWDVNSSSVFINGDFLGWQPWNTALPQMTNSPAGSSYYVWGQLFKAGKPLVVTYKYSLNGADNEAGFGQNHVRYIRGQGTYNMPVDTFGTMTVEPSFGNLTIGAPARGYIPITWLGRHGVHLQVRSSLTGGSWVDHPETDGMSFTNWPFTGSSLFFRLIQPAN